jgi:YVTN family beta-propeller protein
VQDVVLRGSNGHIFVNNEGTNTIQVIDVKTWKATASWPWFIVIKQ